MINNKKRAVAIDGNSLMYRMFYATSNLADYAINNNLIPINAVKLMMEVCFKIRENNYDYCLVAFDHSKKTNRHDIFTDYKAGRKKMPNALVIQIPLIKESIKLIGFNIMCLEGIEADDLIGSFCKLMNQNNVHVDVFSSDKDMLQLVNENTYVHLVKTGLSNIVINTIDNFSNLNNGLTPKQIPDFKAIAGDKSDNLVGVNGIGDKTALSLILKYDNLENIFDHLNELSSKQQKKFEESKKISFMCKELATINMDLFIKNNSIVDFIINPIKQEEIRLFLQKYKINGLNKYLPNSQLNIFEYKE